MPVRHPHRLLIVVPVGAKLTAVVNWLQTNIGPHSVPDDLGPALSGNGEEPATHRYCNSAFTELQCREIMKRLCNLASVTPPTNNQWSTWTRRQKRAWAASVRNTIWTNYGVGVQLMNNSGEWDNPATVLAGVGLQVITPEPP